MGVYMKTLIKQIDEKNEEIADTLISLGMRRPIARILSYLKNGNEVTSVELERSTGLHQPEVSIAMKELEENGWINEREEKKPGKGRPYKVYSLKVGFDKIIAQIERQQRKVADEAQSRIERLKKSRRY
jgi:predicted transcriptional regulator